MIKDLILRVLAFLAAMFTAKQLGKTEARKEQAEENVKELKEDAKIDSQPYVSNPLERMRRKK